MPKEFQFPENCYQKLKKSDDIFDRTAAALVVLRLNGTGEQVPPEEIEFAHDIMTEHHIETIKKERGI